MSSSTLTLTTSDGWGLVSAAITKPIGRIVLSAVLYGCFTTLVLVAFMALLKQQHTHRFTTVVLGSTLVLLYASTTLAVIITILEIQAVIFNALMFSVSAIWFPKFSPEFPPSIRDSESLKSGPENYGSCANTAALTVNILLGDSIVCWRASLL
ncbi:hypothetical protein BD309DRAFT_985238 [Dichomitus squalens]|nr:hypothetical protein BD309DRAFT_985238 [Dichomitus squalens]